MWITICENKINSNKFFLNTPLTFDNKNVRLLELNHNKSRYIIYAKKNISTERKKEKKKARVS